MDYSWATAPSLQLTMPRRRMNRRQGFLGALPMLIDQSKPIEGEERNILGLAPIRRDRSELGLPSQIEDSPLEDKSSRSATGRYGTSF
jgi:hypothetical protein